jgi:hypothetical protein
MLVGVPREIKDNEYRVGIVPSTGRIAGEIVLRSSKTDAAKAQEYFGRALAVSRQQQAKHWELRAAMSLAWLWRDQREPANCSLRFTAGSLKGSTRSI